MFNSISVIGVESGQKCNKVWICSEFILGGISSSSLNTIFFKVLGKIAYLSRIYIYFYNFFKESESDTYCFEIIWKLLFDISIDSYIYRYLSIYR